MRSIPAAGSVAVIAMATAIAGCSKQALNERGYAAGVVDGQWGPATQDAVRRFQQGSGLRQTGELGKPTLVALGVTPRDDVASSMEDME